MRAVGCEVPDEITSRMNNGFEDDDRHGFGWLFLLFSCCWLARWVSFVLSILNCLLACYTDAIQL